MRWSLVLVPIAALLLAWDLLLVLQVVRLGTPNDWHNLTVLAPDPFANPQWRWSPVAAWMTPSLTLVGLAGWRLMHFGAVLLLRDWRLIALTLISYPFWYDVVAGNALTFVVIAGFLAMRGNRPAVIVTYALALLMPRPLVVPLVIYLLATQPWSRGWFAAVLAVNAVGVAFSGLSHEWMTRLLSSGSELGHPENIGPSALIGSWWLLLGIPLSISFLRLGRPGLSGLMLSPYLFPYYLLMGLLEYQPSPRVISYSSSGRSQPSSRSGRSRTLRSWPPPRRCC